jgi:hypothetical protein
MTAKFSQAHREAFLTALRETGNQALAAERAKVPRSWVQLHWSGGPAFRRAVEEAVAEAKRSLCGPADQVRGARGSCEPPRGWGFLDGGHLAMTAQQDSRAGLGDQC